MNDKLKREEYHDKFRVAGIQN